MSASDVGRVGALPCYHPPAKPSILSIIIPVQHINYTLSFVNEVIPNIFPRLKRPRHVIKNLTLVCRVISHQPGALPVSARRRATATTTNLDWEPECGWRCLSVWTFVLLLAPPTPFDLTTLRSVDAAPLLELQQQLSSSSPSPPPSPPCTSAARKLPRCSNTASTIYYT